MKPYTKQNRSLGLTLFELLVVLAILSLLATIVAPRVVGYLGKAKGDVAESQLANLATSLELFYLDMGRYPTEEEGLIVLVEKPDLTDWNGPYFKSTSGLIDPWGKDYLYAVDSGTDMFTVSTLGRDGKESGDGEDADIVVN